MRYGIIALALPLAVSACSLSELESAMGVAKPETMENAAASGIKADPMRMDTIAFADAYCRRDGEEAVAATGKLIVAHPEHPRARLLHGLALDLSGRGVSAFRVLEPLARADHELPAVLRCGDEFVYSGTVTEVAQRRLFRVKTKLTALGLRFPLPEAGETQSAGNAVYDLAALAPAEAPSTAAVTTEKDQTAAAPPPPPMHAEPGLRKSPAKGGRFVHLGSYRNARTLEKGWKSLRKRFSRILGAEHKAVSKVDLGKKKGRYLRLGVSADSLKEARAICRKLKAGGQYCAVLAAIKS